MRCLGDDEIRRFVEGKSAASERDAVEVHLDACATCRALVSELAKHQRAPGAAPATPAATAWGRYRIVRRIGAGAMGDVYEAHDPELERRVALKVLRGRASGDAGGRARLLREARALARLADAHVVTVHDVGVVDGEVFIAMELVDGGTLTQWLASAERSGADVVGAFIEAGRGLAAAHAAGLVHRDFKPDNVLRRTNGHFVVTDFGVARFAADGADDDGAARDDGAASLSLQLTREGALVGTPLYMAPEQLRGEPPDARSDQYAFCVALLEALWRAAPFAATSLDELVDVKARRALALPLDGVAARLRRALLRGLEPDPQRRHASMNALLAELAPRSRRPALIVAAAAATALVVVGVGGAVLAPRVDPPCSGAERHLAGVWDASAREQVRASFAALEGGDVAFARVDELLGRYTSAWVAQHHEACAATEIQREQGEELRDARFACLMRQRRVLAGVVGELSRADAALVGRAAVAVGGLPRPELCGDVERVRADATGATPSAPGSDEIEGAIAGAYAAWLAGRTKEADELVQPALASAMKLGVPTLVADARYVAALIAFRLGNHAAALAHLDESLLAAQRGRHDRMAARAIGWSLVPLVELRRHAEARRTEKLAAGALLRIGGDDEIEARLAGSLTLLALHEGNPARAQTDAERALAIWRRARGDDHYETANALAFGALASIELGRYGDAERALREALAMQERWYGVEHPNTTVTRSNLATVLSKRGQHAAALELHERVLRSREATVPPNAERIATALLLLGDAQRAAGDADAAAVSLERARAGYESAYGAKHARLGDAEYELGRVDVLRGRHEQAIARFKRARAVVAEGNELKLARADSAIADALLRAEGAVFQERGGLPPHASLSAAQSRDSRGEPQAREMRGQAPALREEGGQRGARVNGPAPATLQEAEALFASSLERRRAKLGADHADLADDELGLGRVALLRGDRAHAEKRFARALALREAAGLAPDVIGEARALLEEARASR